MDKVTLHGKVYERSAVVAKRHGYTADYLGQLSRDGKVDAELVGRSWYVHSPSVDTYKQSLEEEHDDALEDTTDCSTLDTDDADTFSVPVHTEDSSTAPAGEAAPEERHIHPRNAEKASHINISRPTETPPPEPPLSEEPPTARARTAVDTSVAPYESYARWKRASYEPDEAELVPQVKKGTDSRPKKVLRPSAFTDPDAQNIKIHSETDQYSIVTGELPTVRLRGKITLQGADPDLDDEAYDTAERVVRKRIAEFDRSGAPRQSTRPTRSAVAPTTTLDSDAPASTSESEPEVESTSGVTFRRWYRLGLYLVTVLLALGILLVPFLVATVSTDPAADGWQLSDPRALWAELWQRF